MQGIGRHLAHSLAQNRPSQIRLPGCQQICNNAVSGSAVRSSQSQANTRLLYEDARLLGGLQQGPLLGSTWSLGRQQHTPPLPQRDQVLLHAQQSGSNGASARQSFSQGTGEQHAVSGAPAAHATAAAA